MTFQHTLKQILIALIERNEVIQNEEIISLWKKQISLAFNYRTYVQKYYKSPSHVTDWRDIPALPTDAFKSTAPPSCFAPDETTTTFLTSGTTGEIRGTHHFRCTEIYELSITKGWEKLKLPQLQQQTLILTPSPSEAPHSSLSHMMATLKTTFCPSAEFILEDEKIDLSKILQATESGEPITLLGTALAFVHLFDLLDEKNLFLNLPKGSWAMETGGYKGSEKTLSKEELYQLFETYLGIQPDNIWNEYSMTELSSQFYTSGIGNPHYGPAWTRIKVINPENGMAVKPGEVGYLVIYDLANYDSCIAIQTQDLAIYHTPNSFTLIGRDPSAVPRGCSRSI